MWAQGKPLSVDDAVAQAIASNPELVAARERTSASVHSARAASRLEGPALRISEELQRYDSPFSIAFPAPGGGPVASFVAREQTINTFIASADQPVLGLLRANQNRASESEAAAASAASTRAGEAELRRFIEDAFLRHFEARAMEGVALSSVRELNDEYSAAQARLRSGVATRAEVLRVETAIANAQQQAIAAHSEGVIASADVARAVGWSNDAPLDLAEPTSLLAAAAAAPPGRGQAAAARPELVERQHLAQASEHREQAATYALLPDVNLEAAFLRFDGQPFVAKTSAYVGVKAQWAIWEWGATLEQKRAAAAEARARAADVDNQKRRIESEVTAGFAHDEAARASVNAALRAITGAEEAYRVTNAQHAAGTATTTDLLQAQAELTQARLNLTRARYNLARARVELSHALGL